MDLSHILQIISALRGESGDGDAILRAEEAFANIQSTPGLSQALFHILANQQQQFTKEVRLTASILLKKMVLNNWSPEDGNPITEEEDEKLAAAQELSQQHREYEQHMLALNKQQVALCDADKVFVKQHLPALLSDDYEPLRTNAAVCIALIGNHDYPHQWPELLTGLLGAVQHNDNLNLVQGGLLAFNILLQEMVDTSLHTVVPNLFPALLNIITAQHTPQHMQQLQQHTQHPIHSTNKYSAQIRTQALDLYAAYLRAFSHLEDPMEPKFEQHYQALIKPTVVGMVTACLQTLAAPLPTNPNTAETQHLPIFTHSLTSIAHHYKLTTPQHVEALHNVLQFETRGAAMKVLGRLAAYFPKTFKQASDVQNTVLNAVGQLLQTIVPYYHANIITPLPNLRTTYPQLPQLHALPAQYLVEANLTSPLHGLSYLITATISFLDTMSDQTKVFPKFVMNKLEHILPSLCPMLMLPAQDVENYQYDINAFTVAENAIDHNNGEYYNDEKSFDVEGGGGGDDMGTTVRQEVSAFLRMAVDKWSIKGSTLVAQSIQALWSEGCQMKSVVLQSDLSLQKVAASVWWKHQEAALICIGRLLSSEKGYKVESIRNQLLPIKLIVEQYLAQSLTLDPTHVKADDDVVFLQARGSWLIAHAMRYLTTQLTENLHKTHQYDVATQAYNSLQFLTTLLPQAFNPAAQTPLPTQIAMAHSIHNLNMAFLAIDHSYFLYQCQQLTNQFYQQHPALKQEYDHCMATKTPVPLHSEYVNTIPIQFKSLFSDYMGSFLLGFANLLNEVSDEGVEPIVEGALWVISFMQHWEEQVKSTAEQHPYIQMFQPSSTTATEAKSLLLPALTPHIQQLTPDLLKTVFTQLLRTWFDNHNNMQVSESMVDIYHAVAALQHHPIVLQTIAETSYGPILNFVTNSTNNKIDPTSKMAMLGPISILLRGLSPGPFAAMTSTTNVFQQRPTDFTKYQIFTIEQLQQQLVANNPLPFGPTTVTTFIPAQEVVSHLLPCLLQLGNAATDKSFVYACCALSSSILAIYRDYLIETLPREQLLQCLQQVKSLALLLIKPFHPIDPNNPQQNAQKNTAVFTNQLGEVDDKDMLVACRVLTQLLVTYQSVLDQTTWCDLLNIVITKLITTDSLPLQHRCIYILSRVGLHHTKALITYLSTQCGTVFIPRVVKRGEMKRSLKTKKLIQTKDVIEYVQEHTFARAINIFLKAIPTTYSPYVRTISLSFLCRLLLDADCVAALQQLSVDDELIDNDSQQGGSAVGGKNGSIFAEKKKSAYRTRSTGAIVEKYSQCSAITKILKILLELGTVEVLAAQHQMDHGDTDGLGLFGEGSDSDGENENDAEDDGADDNNNNNTTTNVSGLQQEMFGAVTAEGIKSGAITLDSLLDEWDDDVDQQNGAGGKNDIEGDKQDYPECPYDAALGIELSTLISSYMAQQQHNIANNQPSLFTQYGASLTPGHQEQFNHLVQFYTTFINSKK